MKEIQVGLNNTMLRLVYQTRAMKGILDKNGLQNYCLKFIL